MGGNPRRVRTANNPSDEGSGELGGTPDVRTEKITGSYRPLKDVHAACGCGWGGGVLNTVAPTAFAITGLDTRPTLDGRGVG